ncbi:antitoxin family protein [Geoglobus sp.]
MPKVIEAVYENGVFKPLEKIDLRDGERVKIFVEPDRKKVIGSYRGIFGKASVEELKIYEEEAQSQ